MSSIWAVAKNTIAQAIRMKIAIVVVVMLLILLPLMSLTLIGDKTLLGRLQTFVSYGLSLTNVLLCLLTIAVSTFTLTNDIRRKQIFLLVSKPIRRFEILCGKFLGVIILDGVLLTVFAVIIYTLLIMIPVLSDTNQEEIARIKREFFTSRKSILKSVDMAFVNREVLKAYDMLEKNKQLPEDMPTDKVLDALRSEIISAQTSVRRGQVKTWEFENVKIGSDDVFFIRYKYRAIPEPMDELVVGSWRIGDFRSIEEGGTLTGGSTRPFFMVRREPTRTFHELTIPGDVIAKDGYVSVSFFNDPSLTTYTLIPQEVQLLYRSGSFTGNYIRVILMIMARLIFLTAAGVSAATWLSFPIAILISLVILLVGMVNTFIVEAIGALSVKLQLIYDFTINLILWFLPKFDGIYNATSFMINAKTVQWLFLSEIYLVEVLIKAGLMLAIGMLIFHFRELAKSSV